MSEQFEAQLNGDELRLICFALGHLAAHEDQIIHHEQIRRLMEKLQRSYLESRYSFCGHRVATVATGGHQTATVAAFEPVPAPERNVK